MLRLCILSPPPSKALYAAPFENRAWQGESNRCPSRLRRTHMAWQAPKAGARSPAARSLNAGSLQSRQLWSVCSRLLESGVGRETRAAAAAPPEAQGALLSPPAVTHPRGFPRLASTHPSDLVIRIFEAKWSRKCRQRGEAGGISSTRRLAADCRQLRCHPAHASPTKAEAPNSLLDQVDTEGLTLVMRQLIQCS